jgi:hypothetical protein
MNVMKYKLRAAQNYADGCDKANPDNSIYLHITAHRLKWLASHRSKLSTIKNKA